MCDFRVEDALDTGIVFKTRYATSEEGGQCQGGFSAEVLGYLLLFVFTFIRVAVSMSHMKSRKWRCGCFASSYKMSELSVHLLKFNLNTTIITQ